MKLYALSLVQHDGMHYEGKTIYRRFYKKFPNKKDVINFLKEEYYYFFWSEVDDEMWEKAYGKNIDIFLNKCNHQLEYEKGDLNTISYYQICDEDCLVLYLEETNNDDYKSNKVTYEEDDTDYENALVHIRELK